MAGATPCFGLEPFKTCPGSVVIGGVPSVSMVASNVGSIPLSADQEFEAGFTCNGVHATPTTPLPFNCPASGSVQRLSAYRRRTKRTTTAIRRESNSTICLTSLWATTICSTEIATNGALVWR